MKWPCHIHTGKQRFLCCTCGRQFVENPANKIINSETRELIDRLLLEHISMAALPEPCRFQSSGCRIMSMSNQLKPVPRLRFSQKKWVLMVQCNELWSFVDNKGNKQWVWLALDADTREIIGAHVGN